MRRPEQVPPLVHVTSVRLVGGFVVDLEFEDGTKRRVDLDRFLWGPMFDSIRADPVLFRQVRVDPEAGTIVWPNGADIDPVVLHGSAEPAGRLDA
ncbi:MAG: DUF2442 domain-containing protein [Actinomycetota bacterium]|nr:DUF2442 domain-containing protein [Actinomycetota bacterium]